jgi:Protein of unknown function (DUF4232)
MLRLLVAMTLLLSCGAPTVSAPASPAPSATRSVALATRSPTPSGRSSPTTEPTGLPKCIASQLQAVAAGVMGADFFVGAVFIANRGTAPCTLRGNPELVLLGGDGSPLDIKRATVTGTGTPPLVVVPVSEFRQDPAGLVGAGATAPLQWSNYCDDVLPASFRVTLPEGGGVIDGTFVDLAGKPIAKFGAPRCDDASGPSTLVVFPFQEPVR